MKKYLLGIVAMVMAIGFSAFTVQQNATTDANGIVYRWHKYNSAGTAELVPVVMVEGTETDARDAFDCPDDDVKICARAYDLNDNPTAKFIYKP